MSGSLMKDTDSDMCWEMSIDESFRPMTHITPPHASFSPDTSMSDIGTAESSRSPQEDRKFIVFEQCQDRLFKRCMGCGSLVINICKSQSGSSLAVTTHCIEGHKCMWLSQPEVNRMAAGNLILPAAILFSGSTFTKFSELASIANIQIMSKVNSILFRTSIYFQLYQILGRLTRNVCMYVWKKNVYKYVTILVIPKNTAPTPSWMIRQI